MIAELCANAEAHALLAGDERKLSERLSASVPAIMLALTERRLTAPTRAEQVRGAHRAIVKPAPVTLSGCDAEPS